MDHNGFERQTRHFPATIKINWTTQLDVLMRDVIVQTFLFVIGPVSQALQVGTKISWCNELESRVIQMDWRILHLMSQAREDSWRVKKAQSTSNSPVASIFQFLTSTICLNWLQYFK